MSSHGSAGVVREPGTGGGDGEAKEGREAVGEEHVVVHNSWQGVKQRTIVYEVPQVRLCVCVCVFMHVCMYKITST